MKLAEIDLKKIRMNKKLFSKIYRAYIIAFEFLKLGLKNEN